MVLEYWNGMRLTSPLPNIFTGVDMKSIIETELPSSSELLTSGAEDSLVMSGEIQGYTLSEIYKLSGVGYKDICSLNEFKVFLDNTEVSI